MYVSKNIYVREGEIECGIREIIYHQHADLDAEGTIPKKIQLNPSKADRISDTQITFEPYEVMKAAAFSRDLEKQHSKFLSFEISEVKPRALHSNRPNNGQGC